MEVLSTLILNNPNMENFPYILTVRNTKEMYEEQPVFVQPNNKNIKVWRYLDFTKFVSILDTQTLYFACSDKFDDPFEGSWPKKSIDSRQFLSNFEGLPNNVAQMFSTHTAKNIGELSKKLLRYYAVNCWHINEYESAAMWKLYLKSNEGIAIQSTYKKLIESLVDDKTIYVGKVKYIDYENDLISTSNMFEPILHKRKSFVHEQEVRCLIDNYPIEEIENGVNVKIDIKTLIEKIYIAPDTPKWFTDLVISITGHYGNNFSVKQSNLSEQPLH